MKSDIGEHHRTAVEGVIEEHHWKIMYALVAMTCNNSGKFLSVSAHVMYNNWIIDSGDTDHMTFDFR